MATKRAPTPGAERVHSKSFNGAKRGTLLRRYTSPTPDRFFGADFALVEFDHHPEPIWSSTQWLKKPTKADLYERWRAAPIASVEALVTGSTEDVLRACARISCGQTTHHDGAARWVGLVRHLALEAGTAALLGLLDRLDADPTTEDFDQPMALDGSEYNKSDYKYGPNVRGADVALMLHMGLTRYWNYALGGAPSTVAEALPPALRERTIEHFKGTWEDGREYLHERLTRPTLEQTFRGVSREYNQRLGIDEEFAMVHGTGF
jgi:hypothetical protein